MGFFCATATLTIYRLKIIFIYFFKIAHFGTVIVTYKYKMYHGGTGL